MKESIVRFSNGQWKLKKIFSNPSDKIEDQFLAATTPQYPFILALDYLLSEIQGRSQQCPWLNSLPRYLGC